MSGEIPPELGNLANLERLFLLGNQLSGEIPPELGDLSKLKQLILSDNHLSGPIPPELGSLSNLERLFLRDNRLNGEILPELASLSNLKQLNLSHNQLSGQIPSELGGLANLTELNLSANQLSGQIPHGLASLSNLTSLHLADSRLTGCIPGGLGNVAKNDLPELDLPFCTLVKGTILYDGRPLPESTDAIPNFSVFTRQEPRTPYSYVPLYDSPTGRYEIPNLPRAIKWSFIVFVDSSEPFNGKHGYPLDFRGSTGIEVLQGQPLLERDLSVYKVIHLTSPVDNRSDLGHHNAPKDTYAPGPVLFTWEPIPEVTSYWVNVALIREPYTHIRSVVSEEVTGNSFEADLPGNNAEEFYRFELSGWNTKGARIARMMSPYSNGYGWDYRFRTDDSLVAQPNTPDRAALIALYNSTDGRNWKNNTSWLTAVPIGHWQGVTTDYSGRVTELDLHEKGLSGEIPPELGNLANLERLYLWGNELGGKIPPELGNLANLVVLSAYENQLTGTVPPELGRLSNLNQYQGGMCISGVLKTT